MMQRCTSNGKRVAPTRHAVPVHVSRRPTLADVAARAGVSIRTAANVVSGEGRVSASTRERVRGVVEELGYAPNRAAQQLRRGWTGIVGLAVPEIDSPYFAELASHVVRSAERRGRTVHVVQTDGDLGRERQVLSGRRGQGIDGLLLSPWALPPEDIRNEAGGPPVVLLGERSGAVDHVAVDNVTAAQEATRHLLEQGRRRIAAVGLQPHLNNGTALLRLEGHRRALAAGGVPADPRLEVRVDRLHHADGAAAVHALEEAGVVYDALFCFTDQLALGALSALARLGRTVPGEVAVVGFDDVEAARWSTPSLSTVVPDKARLAEAALSCLVSRLRDPELPPRDVVVGHHLAVRESSTPTR
jgi:DNA-binding LacI/PurR family transcriptional regulator